MTEPQMPDFVARAIEAQGKVSVDEVLAVLRETDPGESPEPVQTALVASTFAVGRNGWLRADVTDAEIDKAKRRHDAVSKDAVGYYATADRAWTGFLFEDVVERWLADQGITFVRNGGLDTLPDFVIGGRSVGARVRVYRPDPLTLLTWPVRQKFPEQLIFGVFDMQASDIYIAGGISSLRFTQSARIVERGTEIVRGFNADVDVYVTDTSILDPADLWLTQFT